MRISALRSTRRLAVLAASAALLVTAIGAAPAAASTQGCTPGYWKNHDNWGSFSPSQTLASAGFVVPAAVGSGSQTLIEALQGGGGPGLQGAGKILLRAAVASLLNGTLPGGLGIYYDTVDETNVRMASLNRDNMLAQARVFDYYNNMGCPY